MNWAAYISAALVVICTVVQIWWDYQLKHVFLDGRTNERKNLRKRLLWLTLVLFVINQTVGIIQGHQKDKKAERLETKIDSLNANQTNLVQTFEKQRLGLTAQIGLINSNQSNLSVENQKLLNLLATKTSIDPSTRLAIIDANRQFEVINSDLVDLNAWKSELDHKLASRKIQREQSALKEVEEERPFVEKCYPIFDYTIKRFQGILAEIAKQNGDTVVSSYSNLPDFLTNSQKVAEINFKGNTLWTFEVFILKYGHISEFALPRLRISKAYKNDLSLQMYPEFDQNRINVILTIGGEQAIQDSIPVSDYKRAIDELLRNLTAARAKEIANTNK